MKKITALLIYSILLTLSVRADVVWQELFNYTNGPIIVTSTNVVDGVLVTNWVRHSGSAAPSDALVNNNRLENAATVTGGGLTRQDDVNRKFGAPYTNDATVLYASFILNATNLPNAPGTYFAHFIQGNSIFQGKLFALVGTNLCSPNTFRLGVSGAANSASAIFPNDLALNQDYQVVIEWDPINNFDTTLWVSPLSSNDPYVASSDPVTPVVVNGYAFRQASTFGNWFCTISNLVLATTFDEAATNVWASNSIPPSIVYDLKPTTFYVQVPSQLSIIAAGQGLTDFVYLWQKDGADVSNPNGNSYIFGLPLPALTDAGNYSVIVSNSVTGATVTSATVAVAVINGPPIVTVEPTNQAVYAGKNVTISAAAVGTPTITFSWVYNNGPVLNADPSTTNTPNLVVNNIQASNGTLGKYYCVISNPYGTTNTFTNTLTLLTPKIVTINNLHSFVDGTFFLPTNTTIFYTVTNAVVYTLEVTNPDGSVNGGPFTGSANGEFYIQDSSGCGIAVFNAGGTVQPRQGDIVNITGPMSQFNSLLELNLSTSDPSTSVTIVGHTNTLPTPVVLPYSFTNGIGFGGVSNVVHQYQGRLVTLTNSYFAAYTNGATFASGNYTLTNLNGDTFTFFLNAANVNIIGQPIPQFAGAITGPMGYFLSATSTNRSAGFEIDPSSYSDIVTGPNPPVGAITITGDVPVINWLAFPSVSYSILQSTNVAGPYLPVATGLTFTTSAGTYSDNVNTNLPASFYKISSP